MKSGPLTEDEQKIIITMRERKCGYKKIAKALNRKTDTVAKWCRRNGLGGELANWRIEESEIKKRVEDKYQGYEYIGGYSGSDGKLVIRCTDCGYSFNYTSQILRPSRDMSIVCDNCLMLKKKESEEKSELSNKMGHKISLLKKQMRTIQRLCERFEKSHKNCLECGTNFIADRLNRKYCSDSCARRMTNRNKEIKRRAFMNGSEKIDIDISLEKLIERDKNVCHICGKKCNKMSYRIESGNFIVGADYPSVDHMMPMSKGGTHTWDNVKLSHHGCNTLKRDKIIYEEPSGQLSFAL